MSEHEDGTGERESMTVIRESGWTRASDYDASWSTTHLPGEDGGTLCGARARPGPARFYMESESSMRETTIEISDWIGGEYPSRTANGESRCSRCVDIDEAEA